MAFYKIIARGTIGTLEKWSTGYNFGIFGLAPDAENQAQTDAILASLMGQIVSGSVPASLKACLSTQAQLVGFRVEKKAEDESILNVSEGNLSSPIAGTGAPSKTPQDSVVISLRTNVPGARGRGRSYWPALGATLDTGFQLTTPLNSGIAADAKTFIKAVGAAANAGLATLSDPRTVVLAVRSASDHVCRDVVSLQVGTMLDTQRRRRDKMRETYAAVAYP